MGTWSTHAFGNDDAADFAVDLREAGDFEFIQSTLENVLAEDEYLEVTEAGRGVAAAAVLALLNGQQVPGDIDEAAAVWVKNQSGKPDAALLTQAQAVIDRVLAENSELEELWKEVDDYDTWRNELLQIKASLGR